MKQIFLKLALCTAGLFSPFLSMASGVWKEVNVERTPRELQLLHPEHFKVFALDEGTLRLQFWNLANTPDEGQLVTLPMGDGTMRDFRVWETPIMGNEQAAQFPDIKTFTATAVDDQTVSAKLDFTLYGFHAMVYDGENTSFIDPFDNLHDGYYMVHYKRDIDRPINQRMQCQVHSSDENGPAGQQMQMAQSGLPKMANKVINGYQLRTYRLALSCSHFYANAVTAPAAPTVPAVLSKMVTSMNRVNGVYEREFSITMVFSTNQSSLIFITAATDPFAAIDNNAPSCLTTNQAQCNTVVGSSNYDIGHVFTTGSGGQASLGSVCTFIKGQGTTGAASPVGDAFDIDFVSHEMGHQFGSDHTFNNDANGSCGGNAVSSMSFEPGSGSTIMAYAGICAPDNVQNKSDAYFHAASVGKILSFVNATGNCSVQTPTGNKLVKYGAFSATSYSIPYMTPFELTAPVATDSMADSAILYAWEQYDEGGADFGKTHATTSASGPLFRSITPTKSQIRVFPKIASVLVGNLNTAYEKAPVVARSMKFKCLYRNIRNNKGCITIPDETVTVSAVTTGTGAGFKVTSQGAAGTSYTGGTTQTVTWDVVNTTAAPVSAAKVDIFMSSNAGGSWQYFVGTFPNTGTASITVPNPATSTTTARFKVKGSGNVFFNVNGLNFKVDNNPSAPISPNGVATVPAPVNDIKVFPVPTSDMLHITATKETEAVVYNVVGQRVWGSKISGKADIDVSAWAKGVYIIHFADDANGNQQVKQVVIQ